MSYTVLSDLYLEVAQRLCEAIGCSGYFSGSVSVSAPDAECRLTASVIVYRRRVSLPEGDTEPISDLVPVWWEFRTVTDRGEVPNDFSFSELRRLL